MSARRWRIISAGLALFCVFAVVELWRLPGTWRLLSPRTAMTVILTGLIGVALRVLRASDTAVTRLNVILQTCRYRMSQTEKDDPRIGFRLTVLAVLVFFGLCLLIRPTQSIEVASDQGAFCESAADLQRAGGITALPGLLWRGEFVEANRHPLFIGLLSLSPDRGSGQTLAALFGLLTLLTVALGGRLLFSSATSGMAALLLSVNSAFVSCSNQAVCESLLTWLLTMTWLLLLGWQKHRTPEAQAAGDESSVPDWRHVMLPLAAGGTLGLAWLTKGNALPLLGPALLWILIGPGRRLRMAAATLFLTGWLLVAAPLIARNVNRFGSPFYNVNSWLLFEDRYSDPVRLAAERTLAEAAHHYWQTHSLIDLTRRLVEGCMWEAGITLRTLGPLPGDDVRVLPGLLLAGFAAAGACGRPARELLLTGGWWLVSFPLLAWYVPIAAGDRFVLPLIPPVLLYSARGLVQFVRLMRCGEKPVA